MSLSPHTMHYILTLLDALRCAKKHPEECQCDENAVIDTIILLLTEQVSLPQGVV